MEKLSKGIITEVIREVTETKNAETQITCLREANYVGYLRLTFIAAVIVSECLSGKRGNWTYVANVGATFRPPEVV